MVVTTSIKIDNNYIENIFDNFIQSLDQPSFDGINTYIVSLETSKQLKVSISGLGGDEIFAGYPHFEMISKYSKRNKNIISYFGDKINKIRSNRFTNKYKFIGVDEYVALDELRTFTNYNNLGKTEIRDNLINSNSLNLSSVQKSVMEK